MPLHVLFVLLLIVAIKESIWWLVLLMLFAVLKSWSFSIGRLFFLFILSCLFIGMGHLSPEPHDVSSVDILSGKRNGDRVRYEAESNGQSVLLTATITEEETGYERIGHSCRVNTEPLDVRQQSNAGGFDEQQFMHTHRYAGKWEVRSFDSCHPTPGYAAEGRRVREVWLKRIEELLPQKQAFYVEALVFGEDRLMDQVTLERFKKFGLLHAIVISGSHIAFLVFSLLYVLRKIRMTKEKRLDIVLILLPIYGWLTEWSPPVTRAVLVAIILLLGRRFHKPLDPVEVIAGVAAFQLAIQPTVIYDIGFQLTVGLTLFLVLSRRLMGSVRRPWNWLLISAWAQFGTLLFLQGIEQTAVSIWSPLLNLLIGSWIEWVILPGSFILATLPFLPIRSTFQIAHQYAIQWMDQVLRLAEDLPLAMVAVPAFSPIVLTIVVVGMGIAWFIAERRWWGHVLPLILLLAAWGYTEWRAPEQVTFLDVGQGDSIVLEKAGETFVVDTGGVYQQTTHPLLRPFDPGSHIVAPFLFTRGEAEIDGLIVTHADHDHVGGLLGVLRQVRVKTIYLGAYDNMDEKRNDLIRSIEATGTRVEFVQKGQTIRPWLQVLAPTGRKEEENDRSIILLAQIAKQSVLLTGDAGLAIEDELKIGPIDILKAGHHGSNTSTGEELLRKTNPKIVILSVGRKNRYGHPHPDVLERIGTDRIVFRTDEDGSVTCSSAGCEPMIK
ncbi:DNA internalization-related competence protein ComEC/Rec2 [Exiguobacterium sp.]|uniref:DNA internalization-related competence protein ComEC/Rec2 n=1 Tax=Exiguobacterium sp. TaxID=44751 RepID=UPI0028A9E4C8|nr:DNA internalization-related competence protein ComEC/Rec2 [Exiguobacterium sp.]